MLKKFAILLFCGFLTLSNQAQSGDGGIILGLSTSQVGGDDLGGFNKAGLLAGMFANQSISPLLSFQMEMTYIQKGSNNPKMNTAEHENYLKPDIFLSYNHKACDGCPYHEYCLCRNKRLSHEKKHRKRRRK